MTELLQFASEHPWFSAFAIYCTAEVAIKGISILFLRLPNRIMRHWNIHRHGYPPAHCDADGDFNQASSND